MNHETKEQAAIRFAKEKVNQLKNTAPSSSDRDNVEEFQELMIKMLAIGHIAGASWREQQAAGGFDDWWSSVYHESVEWRDWQSCDNLHDNKHNMEKAWQASALHYAKLLAEKDAEIAALESKIAYCESYIKEIKALLGEE